MIRGQKSGPAKTIFGKKSGTAMAIPPTTALCTVFKKIDPKPDGGQIVKSHKICVFIMFS